MPGNVTPLTTEERRLWRRHIEPRTWLRADDAPTALAFIAVYAEYLRAPDAMTARRIQRMRRLLWALDRTRPK